MTEFQAAGEGVAVDEDGDRPDWIEVRNGLGVSASLSGWSLTDDAAEPRKWVFPDAVVPAGGSLVVFSSGKGRAPADGELHAGFRLEAGGGYLALVAPGGEIVSEFVDYPTLPDGYSMGEEEAGGFRPLVFFAEPTPGSRNLTSGVEGFLEPVEFGRRHGFIEEPFLLELSGGGATIRYTTDGSVPGGGHGVEYSGAIEIDGTTVVRAVAEREGFLSSPVVTQSFVDLSEVVGQAASGRAPPGWPAASVNGQDFYYQMHPELVGTVGEARVIEALRALPSLSLVTPLEHLVDRRTGIYVNAESRGREWERPGSIELLDPDGGGGFTAGCGIRIRGGISRRGDNPKHSFRLLFRSEYGDGKLRWPMFGDEGADEFDNLDLRTSTNWNWGWFGGFPPGAVQNTFLRDIVSRDLQGATGQAYTRSRYYHLYLNGVYWGIYMTQERSEGSYAESYFGGDADDYDVVKVNRGPGSHTEATDGDLNAWRALWQEARRHRSSPTMESYLRMQGLGADGTRDGSLPVLLDVDALIDYLLVIYWTANNDAPVSQWGDNDWSNNWYGIRNRERGDEGFRFLVHDAENTFGIRGYDLNFTRVITTLDRTGPFLGPAYRASEFEFYNPQFLHQDLSGNAEYRLRFADRVQRLCSSGGVLSDGRVAELMERRADEVGPAILANAARWGYRFAGEGSRYDEATWAAAADDVEAFIEGRTEVVLGQMAADGLTGEVGVPVLGQRGGTVARGFNLVLGLGDLGDYDAGEIYYTTDGSDPRLLGGGVADTAVLSGGEGLVLDRSVRLMARVRAERPGDGAVAWSALEDVVFSVEAVPAGGESLVISEIHYHPAAPSDDEEAAGFGRGAMFEFVELHNRGELAVSLAGVRVAGGVALEFGEKSLAEVPAGGAGVIVNDLAAFQRRYGEDVLVLGEYSGDLSNGGERLVVLGPRSQLFEEVDYGDRDDGWPGEADGGGSSLVLLAPEVESDAWAASYEDGGSPGRGDERWRDRDGDGSDDLAEWIAGTDPDDAAEVFRVREIERGGGAVTVRWIGKAGRKYRVEFSPGGVSGFEWSAITGEIGAAVDGPMEFSDESGDRASLGSGSYRVVVER